MNDDWRKDRPWLADLPEKLPPPKPRPVPEQGWCARCRRVNPRPGYPEDHDGHDWVNGLDELAYIAGVICPDCLSPEERQLIDGAALDVLVFGTAGHENDYVLNQGIFINPEDAIEDDE